MKKTIYNLMIFLLIAACENGPTDNSPDATSNMSGDTTTSYISNCMSAMTLTEKDGLMLDASGSFYKNVQPTPEEFLTELYTYYEHTPGIKELSIVFVGDHIQSDKIAIRFIDSPLISLPKEYIDAESPLTELNRPHFDLDAITARNNSIRKSNLTRFHLFVTKVESVLKNVATSSDCICAARHMSILMKEGTGNISRNVIIASDLQSNVHKIMQTYDFPKTKVILCGCDTITAKHILTGPFTQTESLESAISKIIANN